MKKKGCFQKLGNRGFAITGILYTLFILFLMILLSVLAGLRTRKDMLETSTSVLEESFLGISKPEHVESINNAFTEEDGENPRKRALVDGKYVFELDDHSGQKYNCSVYLHKGDIISSMELEKLTFIPSDCNEYTYTFSFENGDEQGMIMTLTNIYSFEKE